MSYAIAGLALLTAASLVNALLTREVVKRWRVAMTTPRHHGPHGLHGPHEPATADSGPPALAVHEGDLIPAFTLQTSQGALTESDLAGHPALICFLRPKCGPSRDSLTAIGQWAETHTPSGARLVAVISGPSPDADPLLEAVGPLTELTATEPLNGPVADVFGVRHHPSFVLVDADGTVTETGIGTGSLPALGTVTA